MCAIIQQSKCSRSANNGCRMNFQFSAFCTLCSNWHTSNVASLHLVYMYIGNRGAFDFTAAHIAAANAERCHNDDAHLTMPGRMPTSSSNTAVAHSTNGALLLFSGCHRRHRRYGTARSRTGGRLLTTGSRRKPTSKRQSRRGLSEL